MSVRIQGGMKYLVLHVYLHAGGVHCNTTDRGTTFMILIVRE